jgi:hypothetical protein
VVAEGGRDWLELAREAYEFVKCGHAESVGTNSRRWAACVWVIKIRGTLSEIVPRWRAISLNARSSNLV